MPAKFSILALSTMPLMTVALACGGDDGDGGGVKVPDASMGGKMDAPAANCFIDPTYTPTFTAETQFAEEEGSGATGQNAHFMKWQGALTTTEPFDLIQLELYAGIGAFNGADISPKTIELTGPELNYATCSVCVRIFADATQTALGAQYFATGGSVTLTSTTGNLTGTLTNVTLTKVTVADDFTSTPVNDGCNTTITTASLNAPIEMAGSGSAAAPAPSARVIGSGDLPVVIRHRTF